jgi:hypothetical protein
MQAQQISGRTTEKQRKRKLLHVHLPTKRRHMVRLRYNIKYQYSYLWNSNFTTSLLSVSAMQPRDWIDYKLQKAAPIKW